MSEPIVPITLPPYVSDDVGVAIAEPPLLNVLLSIRWSISVLNNSTFILEKIPRGVTL